MPKASISEMLRTSPLMRPNERDHALNAAREMHVFRENDGVRGTVQKGRGSPSARSGDLGAKLSKLISERKWSGQRARLRSGETAFAADPRQRVVATVFYQGHGGGAAGKLIAHGKYLERDGAGPHGEKGQFYDRDHDELDANPRLEEGQCRQAPLSPDAGAGKRSAHRGPQRLHARDHGSDGTGSRC